nr:MAG TPA: hypothetical protein [Caudoviricetes sp.]
MKKFLKQMCHILADFETNPTMINSLLLLLFALNSMGLIILAIWYIVEGEILWRITHVLFFISILMLAVLVIGAYIRVLTKEDR